MNDFMTKNVLYLQSIAPGSITNPETNSPILHFTSDGSAYDMTITGAITSGTTPTTTYIDVDPEVLAHYQSEYAITASRNEKQADPDIQKAHLAFPDYANDNFERFILDGGALVSGYRLVTI